MVEAMVGGRVVTERALEAWVDKYVYVTRSPVGGSQERLAGRIWAVGNDGLIFQPMDAPTKGTSLPRKGSSPGIRCTPSPSCATEKLGKGEEPDRDDDRDIPWWRRIFGAT